MNKYFVILYLFFIIYDFHPITFTLKNRCFLTEPNVFLSNLITEQNLTAIPNQLIIKLDKPVYKISSQEILKKLFLNNIYEVNLIGSECIIYLESKNDSEINDDIINHNTSKKENQNPILFLTQYFQSIFEKFDLKFNITLKKNIPQIDLNEINSPFRWEINKLNSGLKDFNQLKSMDLIINEKKYKMNLIIKIYGTIWIAKKNFNQNDYFDPEGFYQKNLDITCFNEIETLVFNPDDYNKYQIIKRINPGDVLRWTHLKKLPLIEKGETITAIIKNGNFNIFLSGIAMTEGIENQKIKIKLENGKEMFGKIRYKEGNIYVEII